MKKLATPFLLGWTAYAVIDLVHDAIVAPGCTAQDTDLMSYASILAGAGLLVGLLVHRLTIKAR